MRRFTSRVRILAPAEQVFDWHERPGAFERLVPPWESVQVVSRTGGIRDGDRVAIRSRVGPVWVPWVIEHRDFVAGQQFRDVQLEGPMRRWEHTHRVLPDGPGACVLEDDIVFELPMGPLGDVLGGRFTQARLRRMFAYRHAVTRADVEAGFRLGQREPLRVVVSGASGLIGSELVTRLSTAGHQVVPLVRRPGGGPMGWDTSTGRIEIDDPNSVDAVVHLAGESVAGRWSAERKQRIYHSRIDGTRQIVAWMAGLDRRPRTLVCASATGYYGDRADDVLTEQSQQGSGFLATVCGDWEHEAKAAIQDHTRVVRARFGVVLSPRGGALARMLTPFRCGVGGTIGTGRQFWSWISVEDAASAILHVLHRAELSGAVNIVAPQPLTNAAFTRILGVTLRRPAILPVPALAARLAFGEMASELLLASQRVNPEKLTDAGYAFRHPDLESALRHLLGRVRHDQAAVPTPGSGPFASHVVE